MSKNFWDNLFKIIVIVSALVIVVELLSHLIVAILWFSELGYLPNFITRLQTQLGVWLLTFIISVVFLLGNLHIAKRLRWPAHQNSNPQSELPQHESRVIHLPMLMTIVLVFSLLIGIMLLYYTEIAYSAWQIDYTLPKITPPLPSAFVITSAPEIWNEIRQQLPKFIVALVFIVILLTKPYFWLRSISIVFSLIFGLVIAGNWTRILEFLHSTAFEQSDPQFNLNIAFYIFSLPTWQLVEFWLNGLFIYGLVSTTLIYLLSANSISEGKFPGFSRPQLRHLYGLGSGVMFGLSITHWLRRYEIINSKFGLVYGAGFTDVNVQIPLTTILAILALVISIWLGWKGVIGSGKKHHFNNQKYIPFSPLPFYGYLSILIPGIILTFGVQYLIVQPNELARERPYIERSIALTRQGFALNNIEQKTFDPQGQITAKDIAENNLTIDNIRLWDSRPLLQTNRQLQQIRLYYKFPEADIDRYTLKRKHSDNKETINEKQQVIIAARELDYDAVPERAKTWVNEHLVYTHGYGFTLSPVNLVDEGGLPYYFVKDIGTSQEEGDLVTSSEEIAYSIPINKPRIYYGELTDTYIMTDTKVEEFDYPSGEDNVYNTYDGTGGIEINSYWRRFILAVYLKDWQMLFTQNFTPDTKVLLRRDINLRLRTLAPFLRFDQDPYLVAAKGTKSAEGIPDNYLYWIVDAYTTSDHYPYSDLGDNNFNYIRNSVKIVIDAYNGNVDFYVVDSTDPIIQTWQSIFPDLFKPVESMPATLRSHIRYPRDLFTTQSERLLTYHMSDPQVFYNREDQWRIPDEIYGDQSLSIDPYYLIMKLPLEESKSEEFILVHPYTPISRNNLIAWLFARSDGKQYGKLLLYQLPKQRLIFGPEQIEALINQNPRISQQISLWNRQGSRAIQGNLLIIPVEKSILYVEPLYLEAEQNSLPTLVRVIVVYDNRIIMAPTLDEALQGIFSPDEPSSPTIIEPVED